MAMSSGGETDVFDLGEGQDGEGCVVLEGSMIGLGEMVGMWRPSAVVWLMVYVDSWTYIWLSSDSVLGRDETPCTSSVKSEFRVRSFDPFRKEEEKGVPAGHRTIQSANENEQRRGRRTRR